MSENDVATILRKVSDDLDIIKRLLRIQARQSMLILIEEVATTPERQLMWRLADGTLSNEEIAQRVSVALRSVQYFIQDAENLGLIYMAKRGYPRRTEDIIPPKWKPIKKTKSKEDVLDPVSGSGTT